MAVTGMSGVWPAAFGNLADPALSALRITDASLGYQSAYIISGANTSGAVGTVLTAASVEGTFGAGIYQIQVSGNSATAAFQASIDGTNYYTITATAMGVNTTGTGQWSGFYPFVRGAVVWASGGTNTGTVNILLVTRTE